MYRRHAYFLPNSHRPDSAGIPVLNGAKFSAIFSRQLNPGELADSERANRVVKPGSAELEGNLDRTNIAGIRKKVANAEHSERMPVMNQSAGDKNRAHLAIHEFVRICDSVFNCSGHSDYFEGRTRFVGGGDGAVPAHFVGISAGVVGIERREICHGQQFPGVWILNHHGPIFGVSLFHSPR